jgi:hypothetical protein
MSPDICNQPANCDFEDKNYDFCTWLNYNNSVNEFDWAIYSPNLMSQFSPGIPDNTLQNLNGHFMIATGTTSGKSGKIFSEYLIPTSETGVCFSFFYYFNGSK